MASLALFTLTDSARAAGIDHALWDAVTSPLRVDNAAVSDLLRAGGVAHQGTIPLVDVEALDEDAWRRRSSPAGCRSDRPGSTSRPAAAGS